MYPLSVAQSICLNVVCRMIQVLPRAAPSHKRAEQRRPASHAAGLLPTDRHPTFLPYTLLLFTSTTQAGGKKPRTRLGYLKLNLQHGTNLLHPYQTQLDPRLPPLSSSPPHVFQMKQSTPIPCDLGVVWECFQKWILLPFSDGQAS